MKRLCCAVFEIWDFNPLKYVLQLRDPYYGLGQFYFKIPAIAAPPST